MKEKLNSIAFIFPVMFYFALEAIIVGVVIWLMWFFFLTKHFGVLGYPQIVVIYWIIKLLLFDVFKLIAGFTSLGKKMNDANEYDPDNNNYNEGITE